MLPEHKRRTAGKPALFVSTRADAGDVPSLAQFPRTGSLTKLCKSVEGRDSTDIQDNAMKCAHVNSLPVVSIMHLVHERRSVMILPWNCDSQKPLQRWEPRDSPGIQPKGCLRVGSIPRARRLNKKVIPRLANTAIRKTCSGTLLVSRASYPNLRP
jgi:hypothetical protein